MVPTPDLRAGAQAAVQHEMSPGRSNPAPCATTERPPIGSARLRCRWPWKPRRSDSPNARTTPAPSSELTGVVRKSGRVTQCSRGSRSRGMREQTWSCAQKSARSLRHKRKSLWITNRLDGKIGVQLRPVEVVRRRPLNVRELLDRRLLEPREVLEGDQQFFRIQHQPEAAS